MGAPAVVVAGGSLGGLTAGLYLREAGCDVTVYERSASALEGRGAGIVVQPPTVRYLVDHGADIDAVSIATEWLDYLDRDGGLAYRERSPLRFASWTSLYRGYLSAFGEDAYHLGTAVTGVAQDAGGVTVDLVDGSQRRCDLLVGADGPASTVREAVLPDLEAEYAGYVGWRGVARQEDVPAEVRDRLADAVTYYQMPDSQMLLYPIPPATGDVRPETALLNWVWYVNVPSGPELDAVLTDRHGVRRTVSVPPGEVAGEVAAALRQRAYDRLPGPFVTVIEATAQPFLQVIVDLGVDRMAYGRVCLSGDAAFTLRPHAAAGTAKAAMNGRALGEAMRAHGGDVPAALAAWEPVQLELGRALMERSRWLGRRSQVEGTWKPGDPRLSLRVPDEILAISP
jgi:2,6-dihydroxypyridine 3-monooxygenase